MIFDFIGYYFFLETVSTISVPALMIAANAASNLPAFLAVSLSTLKFLFDLTIVR